MVSGTFIRGGMLNGIVMSVGDGERGGDDGGDCGGDGGVAGPTGVGGDGGLHPLSSICARTRALLSELASSPSMSVVSSPSLLAPSLSTSFLRTSQVRCSGSSQGQRANSGSSFGAGTALRLSRLRFLRSLRLRLRSSKKVFCACLSACPVRPCQHPPSL